MVCGEQKTRKALKRSPRAVMSRWGRWTSGVAVTVVSPLLHALPAAAAVSKLDGHSIGSPPDINKLAEQWFLGGTVIPNGKSLVLNPGVPNRVGMLWSPYPLITTEFEVNLKFKIKGPEKRTVTEDGFAVWYVQENATNVQAGLVNEFVQNQESIIANVWDVALQTHGFDLLGYRSLFNGVGVAFTSDHEGSAIASTLANDGKTSIKLGSGIPATDAQKFDRTKEIAVKIHVKPDLFTVQLGDYDYAVQRPGAYKAGGYVGMTIFGGKKGVPEHTEKSDTVELLEFTVTNLDAAAEGENMPQAKPPPAAQTEKSDLLAGASSFKDHRAESDSIKELTNMVFKLVVETQPLRTQLARAVDSLAHRVTAMEATFDVLKKEIDKKTGHNLGQEFDVIKKELTVLSSEASRHSKERHERLNSLHEDIVDVHKKASSPDNIDHHLSKLAESNTRTLHSLTNEHQKMFGVSIAAIAFVVIAGLSLYNKFRCWEKKHVL
jgi:hypothetical protein